MKNINLLVIFLIIAGLFFNFNSFVSYSLPLILSFAIGFILMILSIKKTNNYFIRVPCAVIGFYLVLDSLMRWLLGARALDLFSGGGE